MRLAAFPSIHWHQPWLEPFRRVAVLAASAGSWQAAFNQAARDLDLRNHNGLPIRFVGQDMLPGAEAYEAFISRTGGVPTRDNLHDFFNALIWLNYPGSKRQLNAIQASELARSPTPSAASFPDIGMGGTSGGSAGMNGGMTRGKVRDRATIFDENAAVLLTSDPAFASALRNHDWHACLVAGRGGLGAAWEVRLFGHALLEKLVRPYKAITAHVWTLPVQPEFFRCDEVEKISSIDVMLAAQLAQGLLTTPPSHLPVLGVPGWASGQDTTFYADKHVFRAKRAG